MTRSRTLTISNNPILIEETCTRTRGSMMSRTLTRLTRAVRMTIPDRPKVSRVASTSARAAKKTSMKEVVRLE